MFRRFSQWLLFTLLVSLVPFGIMSLRFCIRGAPFSWSTLLESGELLLVTFGLAGAGIGDLFVKRTLIFKMTAERRQKYDTFALYCTAFFMYVVVACCASYAILLAASPSELQAGAKFLMFESSILFGCTALCGAVCASWERP